MASKLSVPNRAISMLPSSTTCFSKLARMDAAYVRYERPPNSATASASSGTAAVISFAASVRRPAARRTSAAAAHSSAASAASHTKNQTTAAPRVRAKHARAEATTDTCPSTDKISS